MTPSTLNPVVRLTVEITDGRRVTVKGRDAWALFELINGGMIGVTSIERPAPRWSGYIHKLRRAGISVQTIDEKHGGAFSGLHARYVLRSPVRVVETIRQNDANPKRRGSVADFAFLSVPEGVWR